MQAILQALLAKMRHSTYGLAWFYNGSASCTEKGLAISLIAVIDVNTGCGYSLSVQQTPAHLGSSPRPSEARDQQKQRISRAVIEQITQRLAQLPDQPTSTGTVEVVAPELTRIDHYLEHLKQTRAYLPLGLKYLAADGF